jgi:hypothetical protein
MKIFTPTVSKPLLSAVAASMILLTGCSESGDSYSTGSDAKSVAKAASATISAEVVSWPKLELADALAHKALALFEAKDYAGVQAMAPEINTALMALAADSIPEGAPAKQEVAQLQKDLKDIAHDFAELLEADLTEEEKARLVISFVPISHAMMRAANVPHKHEDASAAGAHDHDHDHDHAHGEEGHEGHSH